MENELKLTENPNIQHSPHPFFRFSLSCGALIYLARDTGFSKRVRKRGRRWQSPPRCQLLASFTLQPTFVPSGM